MASSIDGLSSGLDTTSIIASLISSYSIPQTLLKNRLSTASAQVTALQSINTKTASLATAASAFSGSDSSSSVYTSTSSTSSAPSVTTAVTGKPQTGSVRFSVTQLASAQSIATGVMTDAASAPSLTLQKGGTSTTITPSSGSLSDIVSAINGAKAGVSASLVTDSSGDRRILLSSTTAGADSGFDIAGLTDDPNNPSTVLTRGSDAEVDLGGGILLHSKSNTFTGLVDGASITVSAIVSDVTITTAADTAGLTTKASGLISSLNSVLTDIDFHTTSPAAGVKASSTTGGLLAGNSTLRDLGDRLRDTISNPVGGVDYSQIGVSLDRYGAVTMDSSKLTSLLASDPTKAQALLTSLSKAVETVAKDASNTATGSVSSLVKSTSSQVTSFTDSIADWDTRIAARQATLKSQWASFETTLQKLKAQQSSLSQYFTTDSAA